MLNLKNLIFFRKNVNVGANIFFNVPKNAVLNIYRRTRPEPPQPVPVSSCGPEQPAGTTSQPLARLALTNLMIERGAIPADKSPPGRHPSASSATCTRQSDRSRGLNPSGLTRHTSDPSHKVRTSFVAKLCIFTYYTLLVSHIFFSLIIYCILSQKKYKTF